MRTMRFFYIAVGERRFVEDVVSLLTDFNSFSRKYGVTVGLLIRFTNWSSACLPCKLAEKYDVPLFVDNGAFSFLTTRDLDSNSVLDRATLCRWVTKYSRWWCSWHNYATAMALPDIPVHGRRFVERKTRLERIRLTAELHRMMVRMIRHCGDAVDRAVAVLQGYTVDEYMLSYKLYAETPELADIPSLSGRGVYGGVYGVGSVCVRKPSSAGKTSVLAEGKAAGTLHEFLRRFLNADWDSGVRGFHFFGLHTEAVRRYGRHRLYYASDTGAHGLNFRWKWRTFLKCKQPDKDCYLKAVEHQLKTSLAPLLTKQLV